MTLFILTFTAGFTDPVFNLPYCRIVIPYKMHLEISKHWRKCVWYHVIAYTHRICQWAMQQKTTSISGILSCPCFIQILTPVQVQCAGYVQVTFVATGTGGMNVFAQIAGQDPTVNIIVRCC